MSWVDHIYTVEKISRRCIPFHRPPRRTDFPGASAGPFWTIPLCPSKHLALCYVYLVGYLTSTSSRHVARSKEAYRQGGVVRAPSRHEPDLQRGRKGSTRNLPRTTPFADRLSHTSPDPDRRNPTNAKNSSPHGGSPPSSPSSPSSSVSTVSAIRTRSSLTRSISALLRVSTSAGNTTSTSTHRWRRC